MLQNDEKDKEVISNTDKNNLEENARDLYHDSCKHLPGNGPKKPYKPPVLTCYGRIGKLMLIRRPDRW